MIDALRERERERRMLCSDGRTFDFSRNAAVDFNFPPRRGTGIARYLNHCSSETIDLITQLCVYDPDHRISAVQALRHPYFESVR